MAPDFHPRCDCAREWPCGHLLYKKYVMGALSPRVDPVQWLRLNERGLLERTLGKNEGQLHRVPRRIP